MIEPWQRDCASAKNLNRNGKESTDCYVDVIPHGLVHFCRYGRARPCKPLASDSLNTRPELQLWKLLAGRPVTYNGGVATCAVAPVILYGPLHVRIRISNWTWNVYGCERTRGYFAVYARRRSDSSRERELLGNGWTKRARNFFFGSKGCM